MNQGLLIFGICVAVVLGAALPLLRGRGRKVVLPPKKETLRDWRNGE